MDEQGKKTFEKTADSFTQKDVETKGKDDDTMSTPITIIPETQPSEIKTTKTKYSVKQKGTQKSKTKLEHASEDLLKLLLEDNGRTTSSEFLCLTHKRIKADEKFAKENTQADN